MAYLVTMTTHVPDGTPEQTVDDVRAREAAHSRDLAAEHHLLRLWRPPLQPGEWRTLCLFAADDAALSRRVPSQGQRGDGSHADRMVRDQADCSDLYRFGRGAAPIAAFLDLGDLPGDTASGAHRARARHRVALTEASCRSARRKR
jgi:muconolactone delta-isomerase